MAASSKKRPSLRARAAASKSPLRPHPDTISFHLPSPEEVRKNKATLPHKPVRPVRDQYPVGSEERSARSRKEDKRQVKHINLLRRVRDSGVRKSTSTKKRRRPGKKLQAAEDVSEMKSALEDISPSSAEDEWEGFSGDEDTSGVERTQRRKRVAGSGKMRMRSLSHRPGALKRKHQMERGEIERFGRNMAQMVGPGDGKAAGDGEGGAGHADKWAALRRFIGSTMEKDGAFGGG